MASRVAGKIKLQSVDELLGVPEIAGTQEIEIGRIHAFPNHPFKVFQKKDHLYCRGCEVSKCGKGAVHEAEHGAYPLCNEMYAGKHNQDQEHQAVYAGSTV